MNRCPSLQEWLDLVDVRTSAAQAQQLTAHLESGCAACAAQQAWIGRVLTALPAGKAPGLSENTRLALRELAAARLEARERPLWIATLFRDTRRQLAAGARGSDEGIQLRYEADGYEIRLWAEATEARQWYVIGQVYSRAESCFILPDSVALLASDGTSRAARHEADEFHLEAVTSGSHRLALRLPTIELLIPELALESV